MELGLSLDGGLFKTKFPGIIRSQINSLCAFMFMEEGYTLTQRVGGRAIPQMEARHLDWHQSTALWLELVRAPGWISGELEGSVPGFRRLAEALRCSVTGITLLRLIRLTMTTLSSCFGMGGLPSSTSRAYETLRRRLQGVKDVEPRNLPIGDVLGLQCTYAMVRAEIPEALRGELHISQILIGCSAVSQKLKLTSGSQNVSYPALRAVQRTARYGLRLIQEGTASRLWEAKRSVEPDLSLSKDYETRCPRLHHYIARNQDEWLLVNPPQCNLPEDILPPSLNDVVEYCVRLELESAIAMIEEGAGYFASVWKVSPGR